MNWNYIYCTHLLFINIKPIKQGKNAVFSEFPNFHGILFMTVQITTTVTILFTHYRAKNHFGSITQNYSLEVTPLNPMTSHGPLAVVTGITPHNSTLLVGQSGELTCTVKSHDRPHIKWLKQVSRDTPVASEANILNVKDEMIIF